MATVTHQRHAGGRPRKNRHSELFRFVEATAKRRGMELDQLAEAAGVTIAAVYRLRDPKVSTLKGIASALRVPLGSLAAKVKPNETAASPK